MKLTRLTSLNPSALKILTLSFAVELGALGFASDLVFAAVASVVAAASVVAVEAYLAILVVHHLVFAIATSRPFTVVAWLAFALGRTCFVQPCMEDDECRTEC